MGKIDWNNPEEVKEYNRQYHLKHYKKHPKPKSDIDWNNPEERKQYFHDNYLKKIEKKKEQHHQYYLNNKEKCYELSKKWKLENPDKAKQIQKKYRDSHKEKKEEWKKNNKELLRAGNLVQKYKRNDKKANRGECTLTPQWIVENIFSKSCHYCNETDWAKIGCDRIDNSKPHTPDNVVPCCYSCNCKKGTKKYEDFINETQNSFIHTSI